MLENTRQKTY